MRITPVFQGNSKSKTYVQKTNQSSCAQCCTPQKHTTNINMLCTPYPHFGQVVPSFPFNHETLEFIIPNKTMRRLKPNISEIIKEVSIPTKHDTNINGWFIQPKENKPVFLFLNGTNSNRSWQEEVVKFFHRNGYGALMPDYRGFADNPGIATEQSLYEDAISSLNYLKNIGYSGKDVALWGYSMGGAVARKIAPLNNFKFAVIDSSITHEHAIKDYFVTAGIADAKKIPQSSLEKFIAQKQTSEKIPFDTTKELEMANYPILFLHSKGDSIVPHTMTEEQFKLIKNPKSKLIISEGSEPHFYRNWTFEHVLDFDKSIE